MVKLNMDERQAGITALITAYSRAYHAGHAQPAIFDDYLAAQLFAPEEKAFLEKNLAELIKTVAPDLAPQFPQPADALAWVMRNVNAPITLCRSRYAEDRLAEAAQRGVRQYVLLGAGLDTFTYRKPAWADALEIFEVDHPATQAVKRQRVAAAGWAEPACLHYVPADFTSGDLSAALAQSACDPRQAAFFSWLGVTYYLSENAVDETFAAVAGLAPSGSPLVFDYFERGALADHTGAAKLGSLKSIVRQVGEPMQTGFDPGELGDHLRCIGFRLVEDLGRAELERAYFSGRADGYHALPGAHVAMAVIV
jgi:methyltransferase (TIGR00027 family)